MADAFVEAFASTFTVSNPANPAPHQRCHAVLDHVTLTQADVGDILSHLDVNTSMGPDGLHPHLLKACVVHLPCLVRST